MIVTIDGPSGAGKSTIAKNLAGRLGFRFLDTGAMYRAAALAGHRAGIDLSDERRLAEVVRASRIEWQGDRLLLDGHDVSDEIRTQEVTAITRFAANCPAVREHLVELQRRIAEGEDIVTEGRDQGTVAFPHAECKFFVTATPEERARRRWLELKERGELATLEEVLAQQQARDLSDSSRSFAPLVQAADAVPLYTDHLDIDQAVTRLEQMVRDRIEADTTSGQR